MVFVHRSYDPEELERLGLEFDVKENVVKDKESGKVLKENDEKVKRAQKLKPNWALVGPIVAILIFVMSWAGVVSERAFSAVFQAEQNAQHIQSLNLKHADAQEQIAQQSLMIERLIQIVDKQDRIIEMYNKINEDRNSDNKEHFGRLYRGQAEIGDVKQLQKEMLAELTLIRRMLDERTK